MNDESKAKLEQIVEEMERHFTGIADELDMVLIVIDEKNEGATFCTTLHETKSIWAHLMATASKVREQPSLTVREHLVDDEEDIH